MNKTLVIAVAALVLSIVGIVFRGPTETVVHTVTESLGSGSGQTQSFPQAFIAGIVEGGITATSTGSTGLLPVSAIDEETVVAITPSTASTLTLPASSTLGAIIPSPGMTKKFYVNNRSATEASTITFAGNTGTILKRASSSVALKGDTDTSNTAIVTLTRMLNNNVAAIVEVIHD